jgi:hypothetical protein
LEKERIETINVNFPIPSARWKLLVRWLAGLTTLIYTISRFVPCSPPDYNPLVSIDESWTQTMHFAFAQHLQFGRDLVFTYGPWGFLSGGYYPPTFMVSVMAWVTLSLVFWWCLWQMAHHFWKHESIAWLWMMGFIGVAGLPVDLDFDVRLDAWALILLFLYFFANDAAFSLVKILLVASLGWLGLAKFTGLLIASGIVLIIAADDLLRRRRYPWIVAVFGLSVLFFWLAAGQRLSSFEPFLCSSWRITSGYTEGAKIGGETELWDAGVFCVAAAAACVPVGLAAFVKHRRFGALPLIGLWFVLFVIFKHGFVRHDQHETEAVLAVLLVGLMSLAVVWPILRGLGKRGLLMGWLLGIIIFAYASISLSRCVHGKSLFARFAGTLDPRTVLSPQKMLFNTKDLQTAYENRLAEIRREHPLPKLKEGVDVYPWDQVVVFAHDLRYVPRPVFQSCFAYTPELSEMNATHLRSRRAADNILFKVQALDGQFPSLDDGRSWPELLTRYDIQGETETFALLKKAAWPREYHLVPLTNMPIHFCEPITLPAATNGPIWAELEINKTMLGSVVSTLYKPPPLQLRVSLRNDQTSDFVLIPGMARNGFLLSPLIQDKAAYISLASLDGWRNLTGFEVTSLTVLALTTSGSTACYQSPMQLRLYRLDYPRQDLKGKTANPAIQSTLSLPERSGRTNQIAAEKELL